MNPAELFELDHHALAQLRGHEGPLAVIAVLDGFMDAGRAGNIAMRHLLQQFPATSLAEFDVERLVNHRARRPAMTFDTTHFEAYHPHRLAIDVLADGNAEPFLVLHGPEPDLMWDTFAQAVIQVLDIAGAETFLALYGLPIGVPHTRPVPVTVRASDQGLIPADTTWLGRITSPGSAAALLEIKLEEMGRTVLGLTAHVPHYLAGAAYPAGAQALLTQAERFVELDLTVDRLEDAIAEFDKQVAHEVAASPEIAAMIAQLETHFDDSLPIGSGGVDGIGGLPTGEEIVREFREYLDAQFEAPPDSDGWGKPAE